MIRAGYCTACGGALWRVGSLQRSAWGKQAGEQYLLWPKPDSLYAREETSSGWAPGLAYCRDCAPAIGSAGPAFGGPILNFETAYDRYSDWYSAARFDFWPSWLKDGLFYDAPGIAGLMETWEKDRSECERLRIADADDRRLYRPTVE